MKYSFSSMLGAVLLFSGVFAFSACGNDESYPDSYGAQNETYIED